MALSSKVLEDYKKSVDLWLCCLRDHRIPLETPSLFSYSFFGLPVGFLNINSPYYPMRLRDFAIINMGFALIDSTWVSRLAKWFDGKKCLEIMAGSGALSYALREYGVSIVATDDFSWHKPFNPWLDVENLDCLAAIEKYHDVAYIICSWPYMDSNAYNCLLKMRSLNKKCKMIYIGELEGGCTADSSFFETAHFLKDSSFYRSVSSYSNWDGIHDNIYLIK